MWCDNCLFLFPLKAGGIALLAFIALYQLAGGVFLFLYGSLLFFMEFEPQIYGGIAIAIAFVCLLTAAGFSNQSYFITRIGFVLFPIIVLVAAVRAGVMIFQLNKHSSSIQWECDNGRQRFNVTLAGETGNLTASADTYTGYLLPEKFCDIGVHQTYLAFVFMLLLDFVMLLYAYFLDWRMLARIRHAYHLVTKTQAGPYGYA